MQASGQTIEGVGFGIGLERVLLALEEKVQQTMIADQPPLVSLVSLNDAAREAQLVRLTESPRVMPVTGSVALTWPACIAWVSGGMSPKPAVPRALLEWQEAQRTDFWSSSTVASRPLALKPKLAKADV